jgi:GTP-binding protein
VIDAVAAVLVAEGSRPAEPGEFTRRAFLNGKLDLVAAEAVHDLVAAETDAQRRQALRQLDGALGDLYRDWSDRLRGALARQEALIDFPDEDLPPEVEADLSASTRTLRSEIATHLDDNHRGEKLREGLYFAIAGAPNVGKSSLINALLGSKQAHTSSTPGRTRAINFFALHEGIGEKKKQRPTLIFADLPGYGYAKISKSISAEWPKFIEPYLAEREKLALCICLVDSNVPPQKGDIMLLDWLRSVGREFAVVATKADRLSGNERVRNLAALKKALDVDVLLAVSSKTGYGLKELWTRIAQAGAEAPTE